MGAPMRYQPQAGPVRLNRSNSLTSSLVSAWIAGIGDVVLQKPFALTATSKLAATSAGLGVGQATDGTGCIDVIPMPKSPTGSYSGITELFIMNASARQMYGAWLSGDTATYRWVGEYADTELGWTIHSDTWGTPTKIFDGASPVTLVGQKRTILGVWSKDLNGGYGRAFVDGKEAVRSGGASLLNASLTNQSSSSSTCGPSQKQNAISLRLQFDRALTDTEIKYLMDNPWRLFQVEDDEHEYSMRWWLSSNTPQRKGMRYQPQGRVVIDWTNPLANGLVHLLWAGPGGPRDLVNPKAVFSVTVSPQANKRGMGYQGQAGAATGIVGNRADYGKAGGMQLPFTLAFIGEVPVNASGSSTALLTSIGGNGFYGGMAVYQAYGNAAVRFANNNGGGGPTTSIGSSWNPEFGVKALVADGAILKLSDNGVVRATNPATGTVYYDNSFGRTKMFGDTPNDGNVGANATGLYQAAWNRALSDAELKSLNDNPWQLFMRPEDEYDEFVVVSITTNYADANGLSVGGATASAIASAIAQAYGTSINASVVGATARTVFNVGGSSNGVSTGSATSVSITQAAGSVNGSGSASATGVTVATANGASTATATASGNAVMVWHVTGSSAGITTVYASSSTGSGWTYVDSTGASVNSSTAAAAAKAIATSSGTALGASNVTGQGQALVNALASAVAASTASGKGVMVISASASALGLASGSGSAQAVAGSRGSAAGSSNAQSVALVVYESVANSVGASTVQSVARLLQDAIGKAEGFAVVSGTTEGGVHYTAAGDRFTMTVVFTPYAMKLEEGAYSMKLV